MRRRILFLAVGFALWIGQIAFAAEPTMIDSVPGVGETGVKTNQTIQITFSEAPSLSAEDVTLNGSYDFISDVTIEDNVLWVKTKNQVPGTNYRVEVQKEVLFSYTTSCQENPFAFSYQGTEMEKFYNNRKLYAEAVEVTDAGLQIKHGVNQKRAGRIYSEKMSLKPEEITSIELDAAAQTDTTLTLYYSQNSNNTGFSNDRKTSIFIPADAEEKTYTLEFDENSGWLGMSEVCQLMIEAETEGESVLTISGIRAVKNLAVNQADYLPGAFRFCENYQTGEERELDQKTLPDGTVYAVLDAVRNNSKRDQSLALIVLAYRNGKIADMSCTTKTLAPGEELAGISASVQTENGDTVRAFLRRGLMDIRTIMPAISAREVE